MSDRPPLDRTDLNLAHTGLRLLIGVNFLFHGGVRIPKLATFANGLAGEFEGTWMPPELALPFAYLIPIVEVALGVLLLLGIKLRVTLCVALGLMGLLTAGACLQENWSAAGSQLVYGLVFVSLLATRGWSRWTLVK